MCKTFIPRIADEFRRLGYVGENLRYGGMTWEKYPRLQSALRIFRQFRHALLIRLPLNLFILKTFLYPNCQLLIHLRRCRISCVTLQKTKGMVSPALGAMMKAGLVRCKADWLGFGPS